MIGEEKRMNEQLNPEKILQTGMAFWASKTLLSAVEIGVFSTMRANRVDCLTSNKRSLARRQTTIGVSFKVKS
jgi:hypothetical protein